MGRTYWNTIEFAWREWHTTCGIDCYVGISWDTDGGFDAAIVETLGM